MKYHAAISVLFLTMMFCACVSAGKGQIEFCILFTGMSICCCMISVGIYVVKSLLDGKEYL